MCVYIDSFEAVRANGNIAISEWMKDLSKNKKSTQKREKKSKLQISR